MTPYILFPYFLYGEGGGVLTQAFVVGGLYKVRGGGARGKEIPNQKSQIPMEENDLQTKNSVDAVESMHTESS
jgi:hypothetical protein